MTLSTERQRVVVVGGGYGGIDAAKALDADLDVVLVEPKDAFVHNVGALRALVDPAFLPTIFLPYDRLLARGRVVRDRAVRVGPGLVELGSGGELACDYVVLATGSTYPFPAKSDSDVAAEAMDHYRSAHEALARAARVLLVGAGAVGLELAGEIASAWPDKHVTVLDVADDVLGGAFRADLRAELRSQLAALDVELVLAERTEGLPAPPPGRLEPFSVRTASGRELAADCWFRCFGVVPVADYLDDALAPARGPDGSIAVLPTLQLEGHPGVFAIGDVAAADAKMAGRARREAAVAVANVRALASGSGALAPYEPAGPGIVLPLGPTGGSGQAPGREELLTPEMVSERKGRDLMVDHFAEVLGLTDPPAT